MNVHFDNCEMYLFETLNSAACVWVIHKCSSMSLSRPLVFAVQLPTSRWRHLERKPLAFPSRCWLYCRFYCLYLWSSPVPESGVLTVGAVYAAFLKICCWWDLSWLTSRQKLSSYLALCLTQPFSSLIFKSREECIRAVQSTPSLKIKYKRIVGSLWYIIAAMAASTVFHSRCISKITPRIVLLHLSMQHCCWQSSSKDITAADWGHPGKKQNPGWFYTRF